VSRYLIEPLSAEHDRSRFVSGSEALDRYFREQASQDIKRRIATCFVAVGCETQARTGPARPSKPSGTQRDFAEPSSVVRVSSLRDVAGYYTLTATSVALSGFAPEIVKALPRYPVVPVGLLGRLAVARHYQGQGLGGILLADALKRTSRAEFGVFAMVVDAKDGAARRFYEHYGFTLLPGEGRRLCLPIAAALRRLAAS
jgi:GNAT superfamily N-acetyltransferase